MIPDIENETNYLLFDFPFQFPIGVVIPLFTIIIYVSITLRLRFSKYKFDRKAQATILRCKHNVF